MESDLEFLSELIDGDRESLRLHEHGVSARDTLNGLSSKTMWSPLNEMTSNKV